MAKAPIKIRESRSTLPAQQRQAQAPTPSEALAQAQRAHRPLDEAARSMGVGDGSAPVAWPAAQPLERGPGTRPFKVR